MEIQTNPAAVLQTPKIKCIISHPAYPYLIAGHFTGEIVLYDPSTLAVKKSNKITESAIRTAVILPAIDMILAGTDDGEVVVVDSGSLQIVRHIPAHADFVRKIVADEPNCRFLSTSDDNTVKLWEYKSSDFTILNVYKDSKHYVMDAAFDLSDSSLFYTASLDGKIRQYSIFHTKRISTCFNKNVVKLIGGVKASSLSGLNALSFVSKDCFASGNDEGVVDVFDRQRGILVNSFQAHLGQINSIRSISVGSISYFITASSDNSIKIYDEQFKSIDAKYCSGKVWDVCEKNGAIFVGCDSELIAFKIMQESTRMVLNSGRIFFISSGKLCVTKVNELGHHREIGDMKSDSFELSKNSKLIAVCENNQTTIHSTLGMRNKLEIEYAKDCLFTGNDSFCILNTQKSRVEYYDNLELASTYDVDNASSLLYCDGDSFVVNNCDESKTMLYSRATCEGAELPFCTSLVKIPGCLLLMADDATMVYDIEGSKVVEHLPPILSYGVLNDSVIFYSTNTWTSYGIFAKGAFHTYSHPFIANIFAAAEGRIFYCEKGKKSIRTCSFDQSFIKFQMDILNGLKAEVPALMETKAIAFYESLQMHAEALGICSNDNQRFEILIKLGGLDEAFKIASSPAKYNKLGHAYLKAGRFEQAAECFFNGNDAKSLFLADVFGKKMHLDFVAEKAKGSGEMNLALLAYFKNNNFEECSDLLENTVFYNLFRRNFCNK